MYDLKLCKQAVLEELKKRVNSEIPVEVSIEFNTDNLLIWLKAPDGTRVTSFKVLDPWWKDYYDWRYSNSSIKLQPNVEQKWNHTFDVALAEYAAKMHAGSR